MNIAKEFSVLFIFCISSLYAKDNSVVKEKHLLDDSLKILRKDFNQLIENVEDFVGDFVVQLEEASKVAASVYTDDEYNWQDSTLKTSKHETTTHHSFQSYDNAVPPTVDFISNEIESRKKRSPQDLHNFEDQKHNIERRVLVPTRPPPLTAYQDILGSQQESKLKDSTAEGKMCKTSTDTNLEHQQFEELKQEVRKLGDLVQLLKDQQLLIKTVDERNLNSQNINEDLAKGHFLNEGLKQFEKHKNEVYNVDNAKLKAIETSLKATEKNLKTTSDLLKTEIEKEEMLETELKKQNSELKFIKVMMEHLYDGEKDHKEKIGLSDNQKRVFDDVDVDSIVGASQMPNSYPLRTHPLYDTNTNKGEYGDGKFVRSLMPRTVFTIDTQNNTFPNTDVEKTTKMPETIQETFEDIEKEIEESAFKKYFWNEENEALRDITINALVNMTKHDPGRFKMFNMENRTDIPKTGDHFFKRSSGYIPSSRASAKSRKSDDVDLKLKLIDLLTTNEAKSIDNPSNSDKQVDEVLKSLLKPQKKSDDEVTLETLKSLVDQSRQKQKNEDSLNRLLQNLNKPQSKTEDSGIESELKQLQKAINQLKPKDDLGGFDLGNDGRQDFQSMLSQIISQNPAGSTNSGPIIPTQSSLSSSSILGQNPLILAQNRPQIQQYLNALKPNLYYPYTADSDNYNGNSYNQYQYIPYQNTPVAYDHSFAPPSIYSPIASSYSPYSYPSNYPLNNYYPNNNAYSGKPPQEAASLDYSGNNFFQLSGLNPEYNYGSKSAAQPSLGQSYGPAQAPTDDYKYGMILDLNQQIQNLENVIAGLRSGDYTQNYEDKTAIASLEQRIYDLKGVINSLNSPQPSPYAPSNSPPYQQPERTLYVTPPLPPPIKAAPQSSAPVYSPPQPSPPIPEPSRPNYVYQPSVPAQPSSNPYQPPKPNDPRPPYQSKEAVKDGLRSARNKRLKRQIAAAAPPEEDGVNGSLDEITNVFKQYFNKPKITTSRNVDERSSTLDNLQQTLNNLKLQLGSEKSSEKSLSNLFSPASSAYYANSLYDSHQIYTPHSNKNDMFSEIIVKIMEKVFASLPEALKRASGNLLSDIGDSYGDYDSPLQNVLKNLGSFGQIPLVLIKILESAGDIIKYLKKNRFFREFLLPGLILGLIGGAVLFLIYFLQSEEEPYGYISYHGDSYQDYPKYQPNHYVSSPPNSNTGYDNYYVKKYKSANDYSNSYNNNDRSSHLMQVNDFRRNIPSFGFSRGYYENV
ncbi:uncharacterized protein [Euwallacea similis]|uniref:uncharacterized protein isoform X2 n=1 Tax=Euwallacea similis TaxID=1736056 RepID=UPI00344D70ED